jgi:hypothetical protein
MEQIDNELSAFPAPLCGKISVTAYGTRTCDKLDAL